GRGMSPWSFPTRRPCRRKSMRAKAAHRCCSSKATKYAKCRTAIVVVNTKASAESRCRAPSWRLGMKFRFPIVIIDEDYRSENASGFGIRALATAIEAEGVEVLGVTSFGDLSSFAQQQSRASAFILSIDDEE